MRRKKIIESYDAFIYRVFNVMKSIYGDSYHGITFTINSVVIIHLFIYVLPLFMIFRELIDPNINSTISWFLSAVFVIPLYIIHFKRYPNEAAVNRLNRKNCSPKGKRNLEIVILFSLSIILWYFTFKIMKKI